MLGCAIFFLGKKNFLPPSQLVMGYTFVFKVRRGGGLFLFECHSAN